MSGKVLPFIKRKSKKHNAKHTQVKPMKPLSREDMKATQKAIDYGYENE